MKRNRLLSLAVLSIISFTLLQSFSGGYSTDIRATSATPGCSGGGCHSVTGSNSSNALKVEVYDASNQLVLQYKDNTTYEVRISLDKNNVQAPLSAGFQATFFDATSNAAGTFPGMNSNPQVKEAFVGGVRIVTHKTSNVTGIVQGAKVIWTFDWKTPVLGANDIIVSVIANDANANSTSSGDLILQASLFLPKESVGVKDYTKGIDAIYPNPTSGKLTVKLDSKKASDISIFSMTGQFIKQIKGEGNIINLDVSELTNGNYFIGIAQEDNFARQQFVKY
jgi:hypothetical protein